MKFALILMIAASAFFTVSAAEPAESAAQPVLKLTDTKDCKPTEKLTILKAVFGADKENCIDVTKVVQARVNKKQDVPALNIYGKDPAKGKTKYLEIVYSVNEQIKTVSLKERTTMKFADFK